MALIVVMACTVVVSVYGARILEKPDQEKILSPNGTQLQLNCTVNQGFLQSWKIQVPGIRYAVFSSDPVRLQLLYASGIQVQFFSDRASQLVFTGAVPVQARVECVATDETDFTDFIGNLVNVVIYGPPHSPKNITAIETGPGLLTLFWTPASFLEGVLVKFTLSATNLNSSTTQVIPTQQYYHIFYTLDSTSCDTYSFQVTAMADSGSSPPSKAVIRTIPSIPDISLVVNSVEFSLTKLASQQFILNVRIQAVNVCPDYPVLMYTVVLKDYGGALQRIVRESSTNITIDALAGDRHYTFYIQAGNLFGYSNSSNLEKIVTTDVQSASILGVENTTNYLIQCSYVEGSDARGCVYTISADGVESVTGTITRDNSEGVIVELANVTCYSEVLVYDWKSNGTTGTLPVPVDNSSTIIICSIATIGATTTLPTTASDTSEMTPSSSTYSFTTLALTAAVSAITTALIVTLIFVLLQIALCKCCQGRSTALASEEALATSLYVSEQANVKEGKSNDPVYMEIGAEHFALKDNNAYTIS